MKTATEQRRYFSPVAVFYVTCVFVAFYSPNFIVFAGWIRDTRKLGIVSTSVQMMKVPTLISRIAGMFSSTGTSDT